MNPSDAFDSLSPVDYRYWDEEVASILSENGSTRYKLAVELALVRVFHRRGLCSDEVLAQVASACEQVTTAEVYAEERRIGHDIRALANCIRSKVSDEAKPFVHMTATSYDIIDSANAARYKACVEKVFIPALLELERTLISLTEREAETVQVGRTHGQHAVPITFGYAMAGYVSRLGNCIEALRARAGDLRGKFSGAVGAYNASLLFCDDPEEFEAAVLAEIGLKAAEHSTQIAPPEALTRLFCEVTITAGVLANLADDMRHLQRTEIGEVGEAFAENQVGSSTMPQKRNPINFENAKSCWKIVMPRVMTVFMDQISEHQRDLTNSASGRTYGEMIAYAVSMTKRLNRTMRKLSVDRSMLELNLESQKGLVAAEPLYLMLASQGHPDAHEKVRSLTLEAQKKSLPLKAVVEVDPELQLYLERMTPYQRDILSDPSRYTGIAANKARSITKRWRERLSL